MKRNGQAREEERNKERHGMCKAAFTFQSMLMTKSGICRAKGENGKQFSDKSNCPINC